MNPDRNLRRRILSLALLGAWPLRALADAAADAWPAKPIRILVPFGPGTSADAIARLVAHGLSESLGQTVIVETRVGASGNIAAELVAKAPPDGYLLFLGSSGMTILPSTMGARAVDPERALAPVTVLVTQPLMLVAHPSFPGSTFADVIRMARERPETIAFSTSGIGGTAHLAGEWMMARAGIRLLHVPYAANRALTDVLSGEVPLAISFAGTVLPMVRMGQLKAIAVLGAERIAVAPEVPTLAESGVTGIDVSLWQGLLAPSGTPSAIVQRIARDAAAFLATPDVRERLRAIGVDPAARGPDAMGAQIRQETARWKKVVADAGLTFN